jgi:hypothetical protein
MGPSSEAASCAAAQLQHFMEPEDSLPPVPNLRQMVKLFLSHEIQRIQPNTHISENLKSQKAKTVTVRN